MGFYARISAIQLHGDLIQHIHMPPVKLYTPQAALLGGNSGLSDGIVMLGETLSLRPGLTEVLIIEHILNALLPPGPSSGPSHTSHPNLTYLPPNLIKPSHASHLFRAFLSSLVVEPHCRASRCRDLL
jgi:hypothetical protein